jgi:hypothetical protein
MLAAAPGTTRGVWTRGHVEGSTTLDVRNALKQRFAAAELGCDNVQMPNDAEAALALAGRRMFARRDEITRLGTDLILSSIPSYRDLVPLDDLLESGRRVTTLVLEVLATEGGTPATEARPDLDSGPRRFRQGVALEDILRALRLDFGIFWDALIEEAKAEEDLTSIVLLGARRIWAALDEAMMQITEGYRREEAAQDREHAMRRHRAMAELIDDRDLSAPELARIADALDFDPEASFLVAVARLSEGAATRLESRWRSLGAPAYVGIHASDVVAVTEWSGSARHAVSQIAEEHLVVLNPTPRNLQSIGPAIRLSRVALRGTSKTRTGVLQPHELLIEALTAEAAHVGGPLASEIFSPLDTVPAGERARLLETLRAWSETDGTSSAVARRLYRHRNTVTNHMRRIQELTGLSLSRPRDAATLVLALQALEPLSENDHLRSIAGDAVSNGTRVSDVA